MSARGSSAEASLRARLGVGYLAVTPESEVDGDVRELLALGGDGGDTRVRIVLRNGGADAEGRPSARLKLYRLGGRVELSAFVPILESLGLVVVDEVPHQLSGGDPPLHCQDFGVRAPGLDPPALVERGARLERALVALWSGRAEADRLGALVLRAEMEWEDVAVVRAIVRYARQLDQRSSLTQLMRVLEERPETARHLAEVVSSRLDPTRRSPAAAEAAKAALHAACDAAERLEDDRALRRMLAIAASIVRTTWFSDPRPAEVALKVDPSGIPGVAHPVPFREVFVSSPDLEGLHLRAGPVARGGLRWSDRQEDLRTEVLDLMRAQVLKNAAIVPTGAKGGFVLRRSVSRDERFAEGQRCYERFVSALLALTDNRVEGRVVGPEGLVRLDGDDPYLVVAPDRGTATFSDLANSIALRQGFWLGDAFASGGSNGYDHKAIGITSRGAWVAIGRHFTELGIDPDRDGVSVVGIGDMSGDVFGNGLLASRGIRLLAAFDHRDIFVDPDPDPEASFAERQRLFGLERSSWQDYDRSVLSPGGGIWPRDAKRIELSDGAVAALGLDTAVVTPAELVRGILRAPVDLLFAGGIGTFVRSSGETDADVGDRANDELRVRASELRARVVGEGANLCFTSAARVEFARRGGRIDLDAVDNAAGVALSDREVNLKIAIDEAVASRTAKVSETERRALLEEATEEVVSSVLADVARQALALSADQGESVYELEGIGRLIEVLERRGFVERALMALPSPAELVSRQRKGAGLVRPELAVIADCAKRLVIAELLDSAFLDVALVDRIVDGYFPSRITAALGDALGAHPLRRELRATLVANELVDRMGLAFLAASLEAGGTAGLGSSALAFTAASAVLGADRYWRLAERVGPGWPSGGVEVATWLRDLLCPLVRRWERILSELPEGADLDELVQVDRASLHELEVWLLDGNGGNDPLRLERGEQLMDGGLRAGEAAVLACLPDLRRFPVLQDIAMCAGVDVVAIAEALDVLEQESALATLDAWVRAGASSSEVSRDRWARMAVEGLRDELDALRRRVVLSSVGSGRPADGVRRRLSERAASLRAVDHLVAEAAELPLERRVALAWSLVRRLQAALGLDDAGATR